MKDAIGQLDEAFDFFIEELLMRT